MAALLFSLRLITMKMSSTGRGGGPGAAWGSDTTLRLLSEKLVFTISHDCER